MLYDTFFSNGQTISEEEYYAAQAQQEAKPLAQWQEFPQENLKPAFPQAAS